MLLLLWAIRSNAKYQKRKARSMENAEGRLQNVTMSGLKNMESIKSMGGEKDIGARASLPVNQRRGNVG